MQVGHQRQFMYPAAQSPSSSLSSGSCVMGDVDVNGNYFQNV